MKAIVLAAGKGVRLEPFTAKMPKHLLPVAGAPLIEHTLRSMRLAGIRDVLVVVHHMGDQISSSLGSGSKLGLNVEYVDQGGIFGTGHAMKMGEDFVGKEPFLVVYGDLAVHPRVFSELISAYPGEISGVVAGVDLPDVSEYGVLETRGGLVSRIVEKPRKVISGTINGGIYLFNPEIFDFAAKTPKSERGEFELTTTVNMAIDAGRSFGLKHIPSDWWVDVGRPWNILDANRLLMDSIPEKKLSCGSEQNGCTVVGKVVIEKGAELLPGTFIEGPVWISSGCRIGPNCHLRPYTYLCNGVRVGNACEIKGSILMQKVHVGHLSYIGDSVVGVNSNLGAGTITANLRFDDMPVKVMVGEQEMDSGRRKLGAFLGEEVKTGINVSLFPGVKVGYGSWIGPHVSLDRDVPPMTLVKTKIDLEMRQRR
jgi:bifunctional UDP-N-acetylglucosamine pyrophosphorylase/glucosamine-1-phosphate N-acetyltransferase